MSATVVSPSFIRQRARVQIGSTALTPILTLPNEPRGLVLMPSASGDRAYERVNRAVTVALQEEGFATVEADLLTREEAADDAERSTYRFDLDFIAGRVAAVLETVSRIPALGTLEAGAFAAGTCAAGVLVAAAERPDLMHSIVCRSARPELAGNALVYVHAAVLMVLGDRDVAHRAEHAVAMSLLPPRSRLEIVSNARHLLDRPEDVRRVSRLTVDWFRHTLTARYVIAGRWTGPAPDRVLGAS